MAGRLRLSATPRSDAAPWLAVCALAVGGALALWLLDGRGAAGIASRLDWQPGLAWQQPWRAVSAAWVHLSLQHLLGNLVGAALVATYGAAAGCGRRAAGAWLLAWPLTHAALLLQPALLRYGGLSGLMHAGVAIACWQLLRGDAGRRRAIGAAVAAMLLLKLLLEAPWQGPLRQLPGWDIAIAPLAHTTGTLAGWLCAAACGVGGDAGRRGLRAP